MTTIVVEEFRTTLVQDFTWGRSPRAHVTAVRPYLYLHNTPAGTFTMAVLNASSTVLASQTFTAQDVYDGLSTTDDYSHAFFRVAFANKIHLPAGDYKLRLSASGYSFAESSYMGWIREHEYSKVPTTFVPTSDLANPLSYEIWVEE